MKPIENFGKKLLAITAVATMAMSTLIPPTAIYAEELTKKAEQKIQKSTNVRDKNVNSSTRQQAKGAYDQLLNNTTFFGDGLGVNRYSSWQAYFIERSINSYEPIYYSPRSTFGAPSGYVPGYHVINGGSEAPAEKYVRVDNNVMKFLTDARFTPREAGFRQTFYTTKGRSYTASVDLEKKDVSLATYAAFVGLFDVSKNTFPLNEDNQFTTRESLTIDSKKTITKTYIAESEETSFIVGKSAYNGGNTRFRENMEISNPRVTLTHPEIWSRIDGLFSSETQEYLSTGVDKADIDAVYNSISGEEYREEYHVMRDLLLRAYTLLADQSVAKLFSDEERTQINNTDVTHIQSAEEEVKALTDSEMKTKMLKDIEIAYSLLPSQYDRDNLLRNISFYNNGTFEPSRYGNWSTFTDHVKDPSVRPLIKYGEIDIYMNTPLIFMNNSESFKSRPESAGMVFELPSVNETEFFVGMRQQIYGIEGRTYITTAEVVKNGFGGKATAKLGFVDLKDEVYSNEVVVGEGTPKKLIQEFHLSNADNLNIDRRSAEVRFAFSNKEYQISRASIYSLNVTEKYKQHWEPIDNLFVDTNFDALKQGVSYTQLQEMQAKVASLQGQINDSDYYAMVELVKKAFRLLDSITPDDFMLVRDSYVTGTAMQGVHHIKLKVGDKVHSGGEVKDGNFRFYAKDKIKSKTEQAEVIAFDAKDTVIGTKTVNVKDYLGQGSVTPDNYSLISSKYITGKYTGDVVKMKLRVDGKTYSGGEVIDGTIKFYARDKIKADTKKVEVMVYDAKDNLLDTEEVIITTFGQGSVTPDNYSLKSSRYITGKYTGDAMKMKLKVDGTTYSGGEVINGTINFYARDKIKADTKKVEVLVYDVKDNLLDTEEVVVTP
ncbi:hypothetical protein HCA69_07560 [Listeria grandensis]|uniref:Uncharacterized protein n=1 Tax=Listeria grandensis TaxID=1494963 RepID=A0A7X1CPQ2_9LIST|nr:immunoglobulin-like domain-containing protein [Listeria grandensis]MBC1936221.1 hypothetical protein [Listeria grandensis]